ncbi:hypothetical protein CFP56_033752 [Quercus suber]|uniref:Uncharacterized protein n=1 Tax=Quercus suber TaxID=58331 RepID=A0AAW0LQQ5_QUESU
MPEKMVDKILEEFQEKGLIEPALQKRKPQVKSYKMHPFVRSAVAVLSKNMVPREDQLLNRIEKSPCPILEADLERLVTIFNVSEPFPDLKLAYLVKTKDLVNKRSQTALEMKEPRAVDWLLKMKDARPRSTKSHIEVESIEFLERLANSKDLRFLSLQGVSRINKLQNP